MDVGLVDIFEEEGSRQGFAEMTRYVPGGHEAMGGSDSDGGGGKPSHVGANSLGQDGFECASLIVEENGLKVRLWRQGDVQDTNVAIAEDDSKETQMRAIVVWSTMRHRTPLESKDAAPWKIENSMELWFRLGIESPILFRARRGGYVVNV